MAGLLRFLPSFAYFMLLALDIAKEWRSAHISNSESTSSRENGWNEQMEPKWFEIAMPDDVEELFTNEDFADEDFSECSDMSDDEN